MIISRTPFRISFSGGGSDLPDYYRDHGGCVVSVPINKYVYLAMHPYFMLDRYFLKYSHNELVDNVDSIQHPIIRQVFKRYNIHGVDFNSSADVPSGTGLGSSSAFTVGLVNLCNAYVSRYMSQEEIAALACRVEIDDLHEPIGKQDQYGCAIGGLKYVEFMADESVTVRHIVMRPDTRRTLEESLMMFYLGGTRAAGDILAEQKKSISEGNSAVSRLHKLVELTRILRDELAANNVESLGEILHTAWTYKKELSSRVTNERIDYYYELALRNGAVGGKLLGAGGSGFLLFYVRVEDQPGLRVALKDLQEYSFGFDQTGTGIIYYS